MAIEGATKVSLRPKINVLYTGASDWSLPTIGQMPVKSVVPSAPVLDSFAAPGGSVGQLEAQLTLPTTNNDGSRLYKSEIIKVAVHYKTSSGVTITDPANEFAPGETILWGPGDTTTYYIAVRVMDSHENWSALSNELSAAASASTPQEESGLWAHRLGYESIFTNNSPSAGSVAWSNVVLYWKANKYTITDGNTSDTYIWWDYSLSTTTFQTSNTKPDLAFEDIVIATNDSGTARKIMYAPTVQADWLKAGVMQSTNWGASTGSQIDLDNGTIRLGGSSSPAFSVASDGKLTATGATISGAVTITSGSGYANLSDTPTSLGDISQSQEDTLDMMSGWRYGATTYIDGADIHTGTVTADKIVASHVSSVATNTGTLTVDATGYIKSSNYSAGSTGFKIEGDGDAEFNDVTVRGAVIPGAGSSISGTYINNIDADDITSGTITGRTIQTSASGARIVLADSGYTDYLLAYNDSGYIRAYLDGNGDFVCSTINGPLTANPTTTCTLGDRVHGRVTFSGTANTGTLVFNSTAPTSWTDLDLSSVVGSRQAMVFLAIQNNGAGDTNYRFRPNGSSREQTYAVDNYPCACAARINDGKWGYAWAFTHTDGKLEWDADLNRSTKVYVMSFVT